MKKIKTVLLFALVYIVAISAEIKYISFDVMFFATGLLMKNSI